jgi:hypothetical protein
MLISKFVPTVTRASSIANLLVSTSSYLYLNTCPVSDKALGASALKMGHSRWDATPVGDPVGVVSRLKEDSDIAQRERKSSII